MPYICVQILIKGIHEVLKQHSKEMDRIVIYAKDIQVVTGKSERTSRTILKKIRESFSKEKHQAITVSEFCRYLGLPLEEVTKKLRLN